MNIIQSAFLWFYCLSIPETVIILFVITLLFLFLQQRYGEHRFWNPAIWAGYAIWIVIIGVMTLGTRSIDRVQTLPVLVPLHSYAAVLHGETTEILRSNYMNVLLFYPVGLLMGSVLPSRWEKWWRIGLTVVLGTVISAGIEFCQYYYCLGTAEIDDVIHNILGAIIGAFACGIPVNFAKK